MNVFMLSSLSDREIDQNRHRKKLQILTTVILNLYRTRRAGLSHVCVALATAKAEQGSTGDIAHVMIKFEVR